MGPACPIGGPLSKLPCHLWDKCRGLPSAWHVPPTQRPELFQRSHGLLYVPLYLEPLVPQRRNCAAAGAPPSTHPRTRLLCNFVCATFPGQTRVGGERCQTSSTHPLPYVVPKLAAKVPRCKARLLDHGATDREIHAHPSYWISLAPRRSCGQG
jgi:hypothetical protein